MALLGNYTERIWERADAGVRNIGITNDEARTLATAIDRLGGGATCEQCGWQVAKTVVRRRLLCATRARASTTPCALSRLQHSVCEGGRTVTVNHEEKQRGRANEIALRQLNNQGRQTSAAALADMIASDPRLQQQIRDSDAENRWARAHYWVEESELCSILGVTGFQDARVAGIVGVRRWRIRLLLRPDDLISRAPFQLPAPIRDFL